MSGQRQRRWASIETVLGNGHRVFAWGAAAKYTSDPVLKLCWASIVDNLPAMNEQWGATLSQH